MSKEHIERILEIFEDIVEVRLHMRRSFDLSITSLAAVCVVCLTVFSILH